jgi:hypothetical protein
MGSIKFSPSRYDNLGGLPYLDTLRVIEFLVEKAPSSCSKIFELCYTPMCIVMLTKCGDEVY